MRFDLLLLAAIVVCLLSVARRGGCDVQGGPLEAPGPQNRLRFDRAEVLRKLCGKSMGP